LLPDRVNVFAPLFTSEPLAPAITPANSVSDELATVNTFPAVATEEVPDALVKLLIVAPLVVPVRSSVVDALNVTLDDEAIAPEPDSANVPAVIDVAPV
jgi:hypothetical protein